MTNFGAVHLLKGNPLFRGLSDARLKTIAELGCNRSYGDGEIVFLQGEPGDALYGVIAGEVTISTESDDGQVLRLNTHLPGEITGEIALLDGGTRTATATMLAPGTLFVLERKSFLRLLKSQPMLAIQLLELVCARIRWTSRLLEETSFLSVAERLASRLLWLSRTSGEKSSDGVRIRISQAELAQWLNVSRQVVNGYLQNWQAAGALTLSRGRVVIQDPARLDQHHFPQSGRPRRP